MASVSLTEDHLVQREWERHVDDGEVVDGEAADDAHQEEHHVVLEAVREEPAGGQMGDG